jgi:hypothetical protein
MKMSFSLTELPALPTAKTILQSYDHVAYIAAKPLMRSERFVI